MKLPISTVAVFAIGILHALFMIGELFPWKRPLIIAAVLKKWPQRLDLSANDLSFVATVVHNAGVYNGIVAAALLTTAAVGPSSWIVQAALLAGCVFAGLFGAFTLTKATVVQAVLSSLALLAVILRH
jgi:uncharacterized membrane protein